MNNAIANRYVLIIPLPSTNFNCADSVVDVLEKHITICKKLGYSIIKSCTNGYNNALEIHSQKAPDTVTLVETHDDALFKELKQRIEQLPVPEVLPTNHTKIQRSQESNMRKNYNRIQNNKFNAASRNYKGRKR